MSAQLAASVLPLPVRPVGSRGRPRMTSGEKVDALRRSIRHLLDLQKMTPTALANKVGLAQSVVNRFMSGQSSVILPKTLRRIAKGLGVTSNELRRYRVGGNINEAVEDNSARPSNCHDRVRERISDIILHRGLTVFAVAKRAKVTPPTLYNFMSGKTSSLRNGTLKRIAKSLDFPVSFFLKPELTEEDRSSLMICAHPAWNVEEPEMTQNDVVAIAAAAEVMEPEVQTEDDTLRLLKDGLPPLNGELRIIRAPNSFETIRRGDILFVDTRGDIIYNALVLMESGNGTPVLRRSLMDAQPAMLVVGYVTVA